MPELDQPVGRRERDPKGGSDPGRTYRARRDSFEARRDAANARVRQLMHGRVLAFAAVLAPLLWPGPSSGTGLWARAVIAIAGVIAFIILMIQQARSERERERLEALRSLNDEGLARLTRDWARLRPRWPDPPDPEHAFAADLDLFGRASLAQLLGPVGTGPGRRTLRGWLLGPAPPSQIRQRQQAVEELAPMLEFRDALAVGGRPDPRGSARQSERFMVWAEGSGWLRSRPALLWAARLLPPITLALIALHLAGVIGYHGWLAAVTANLALTFTLGQRVQAIFGDAFAREGEIERYAPLFELLDRTPFRSPLLSLMRVRLHAEGIAAHEQMRRLQRLLHRAEFRYSMFYLPVQAVTLWDFHVLDALERWKRAVGRHVRSWLGALGEVEALSALATLRHDHPDWSFPVIVDEGPVELEAGDLGHPLLPSDRRVPNDVRVGPPGSFVLVTGSNMSGKSTLLRAIGVNVVLAQAGAPVCAASMRLPPLDLHTSMRVHDSLQAGLSQFMAELKRLKAVVTAAERARAGGRRTLLYLLDDVLQGTNTAERRVAVRRILGHLLAQGAIGAITSHDLSIASSPDLSDAGRPVHFSETIDRDEEGRATIVFDYRLRPGIASSTNALELLAIVGLDAPARGTVIGPRDGAGRAKAETGAESEADTEPDGDAGELPDERSG